MWTDPAGKDCPTPGRVPAQRVESHLAGHHPQQVPGQRPPQAWWPRAGLQPLSWAATQPPGTGGWRSHPVPAAAVSESRATAAPCGRGCPGGGGAPGAAGNAGALEQGAPWAAVRSARAAVRVHEALQHVQAPGPVEAGRVRAPAACTPSACATSSSSVLGRGASARRSRCRDTVGVGRGPVQGGPGLQGSRRPKSAGIRGREPSAQGPAPPSIRISGSRPLAGPCPPPGQSGGVGAPGEQGLGCPPDRLAEGEGGEEGKRGHVQTSHRPGGSGRRAGRAQAGRVGGEGRQEPLTPAPRALSGPPLQSASSGDTRPPQPLRVPLPKAAMSS